MKQRTQRTRAPRLLPPVSAPQSAPEPESTPSASEAAPGAPEVPSAPPGAGPAPAEVSSDAAAPPAAPAPPRVDPDIVFALGDGAGVVERTLFVTATRLFPVAAGEVALFAARLSGQVLYAAQEQMGGNGAPLNGLAKQVRTAGGLSRITAPPPQWSMMTLVAQAIALTLADFGAHLASSVTVAPPVDGPPDGAPGEASKK